MVDRYERIETDHCSRQIDRRQRRSATMRSVSGASSVVTRIASNSWRHHRYANGGIGTRDIESCDNSRVNRACAAVNNGRRPACLTLGF